MRWTRALDDAGIAVTTPTPLEAENPQEINGGRWGGLPLG